MKGPGHTTWEANDDGSITQRYHGDDCWATRLMNPDEVVPWRVASALREAYLMGMEDKAEQMWRVLGVPKP
jgi:hypothetical protein